MRRLTPGIALAACLLLLPALQAACSGNDNSANSEIDAGSEGEAGAIPDAADNQDTGTSRDGATNDRDASASDAGSDGGTTSSNCQLVTDTTTYWPAPSLEKPGYLASVTDPTFGLPITRIVGDPGDPIPNIPGEVWPADQERHGYSKRQPWNADQTMLYLDRCSPDIWLDGQTYEVLFTRHKPGSSLRWSHSDPEVMHFIRCGSGDHDFLGDWNVLTDSVEEKVQFDGYDHCSFGEGEGNFTNDDSRVAVYAQRENDGHDVVFILDRDQGSKGPDIDLTAESASLSNCTLSQLGTYLVIVGDFGEGPDRVQVRDAATGAVLYTETEYGWPSHFDTQLDQDGNEVIVGVGKGSPYNGRVIKRILSTGEIQVVCDYPYASHVSGRNLQRPGWVFVTYQNRNEGYPHYINEVVAVKLDGTRTERIAHLHSDRFTYVAEAHAVPSPDGTRVLWASDWDSGDYPIQAFVADFRDRCFLP